MLGLMPGPSKLLTGAGSALDPDFGGILTPLVLTPHLLVILCAFSPQPGWASRRTKTQLGLDTNPGWACLAPTEGVADAHRM